jgi:regulator of sigma E protease
MGLVTFLAFIVVIGVLVVVHEFGHLIAAKLVGVRVEEFAVGFGKQIVAKNFRGTIYRINLIPLGGYVKLEGEDGTGSSGPTDYRNKPIWAKAIILFAGIIMNLFLAVGLFAGYLFIKDYTVELPKVTEYQFQGVESVETRLILSIDEILTGSNALGVLNSGDIIVSANDKEISSSEAFTQLLEENQGKSIKFGVVATSSFISVLQPPEKEVTIELSYLTEENDTILGAMYYEIPVYILRYPKSIQSSISHTVNTLGYQVKAFSDMVSKAIAESNPSYVAEAVGGVVAVGGVINSFVAVNAFTELINLTAVVSLSLAMINLLPISLLDGGQFVLEVVQSARRRNFREETIAILNWLGLGFVLLLTVAVTVKDIWQYGVLKSIADAIRTALGR